LTSSSSFRRGEEVNKQDSTRDDMIDLEYSDFGKPVGAQAPSSGSVKEAPEE
jgi:hypothetical protein